MRRVTALVGTWIALGGSACGSSDSVDLDAGDAVDARPRDAAADHRDAAVPHDAHDSSAAATSTCTTSTISRGCTSGVCTVTGPDGALSGGATVTVSQIAVPTDLQADALGPYLCSLTTTGTEAGVTNLTLSIVQSSPPPKAAVLFRYMGPDLSELVVTSQAATNAVEGIVSAPGVYGATSKPAGWAPAGTIGLDVSASATAAELLRNVSGQQTTAAFYDGAHLFVCNGPRLLIYNSFPANPAVLPDVVLGQPDVDTFIAGASSSLFGTQGCSDVWSDGTRLIAAQFSRVLIWNAIPTTSLTPADVEVGQPDFSSNAENSGGVSATSLIAASTLDSNGTQLVVGDTYNNRALVWSSIPTLVDQPADFVIGQPDFTSNTASSGATPLATVTGVRFVSDGLLVSSAHLGVVHVPTVTANNPASDYTVLPFGLSFQPDANELVTPGRTALAPGGALLVRDQTMARIAAMNPSPVGPATINFVLGQPDVTRIVLSPISASVVQTSSISEAGLNGGKRVLVTDSNRLLTFDADPTYNFAPASRVLGQAGFSTNGQVDYRGINAATLAKPSDASVSGGILAVADEGNNRVLLFHTSSIATGDVAASVVLGQTNATSYTANVDQVSPSSSTLSGPAGVALDGTHLIVSDTENHRVLIWTQVPTSTGTPADLVLGQTSFSANKPNHGNGDGNGDGFSDADAVGLFYPTGVASDGTHLFVADRLNHRVLVWYTFPTTNGQQADSVIGQANFTDVLPNANQGGYALSYNGLDLPTGVSLVGTSLWIADTENNRAVRWDNATSISPTPAAQVLGQPTNSILTNPNYPWQAPYVGQPDTPGLGTATQSMLRPRSVVVSGDQIYVSEVDSNRVHMFNSTTLAAVGELGQASDSGSTPDADGVTAATLSSPRGIASDGTELWVADSGNHRVLGYGLTTDPVTGAAATVVLGQASFLTGGFNQTSNAAGGATSQPRGLSISGTTLYVADTNNNRVTAFTTPVSSGQAPFAVYGQPNGTLALPNSGGNPSAKTLSAPRGVYADSQHVVVADTGNNRVLVYSPISANDAGASGAAAVLVLGQSGPTTSAAGTPSSQSMQGPTGVFSDGTSLWVADTGNSRVLVWSMFPTSDGQAADLVLGQTGFSGNLSNGGTSVASSTTLALPSDVIAVNGVLYVADSGNNRIVLFSKPPAASGAAADGVLGQADLTARLAAVAPGDLGHLAGPVKFATDTENLYVADRDLGRVVVYGLGLLKSAAGASAVIGVQGGLAIATPGGVAASPTPFFTSNIYIADTGSNQIDVVAGMSRLAGDY